MNLTTTEKHSPMHLTRSKTPHRRGNLLVGCGVVILIFIILAGIGTYFVVSNLRTWTAEASTSAIDKMLAEAKIDPAEHAEIMVHVDNLMERFVEGEVEWSQFGNIADELMHSPVIPAALVIGLDQLYFAKSGLPPEEQAQARIELARYTQGLFDESLPPNSVNDVLAPVVTNTPDSDDIKLNMKLDENGRTITALRSADEVSDEDLRTLIATAKAKADEVGITETPEQIDLSDEIGRAIGVALGEIEDDSDDAEEVDLEEATEDLVDELPDAPADDDGP